jgi:putative ABC transport system ATP-binding protein
MDEKVAIRCRGVTKSYGKGDNRFYALKGIDLDLFYGELTLMVGPSGSGKTSLLSILATILTPDAGEVIVMGHDVHNMSDDAKALFRRENIGIVFQSFLLVPSLTVLENVTIPLMVSGYSEGVSRKKALDLLKKLGLERRANSSPSDLSKGQQQKIAIARAIINDAKIIVCDEPTSSLDHVAGNEVMQLLQQLALETNRAVMVVTHDHRIFSYANRVISMDDGLIKLGNENG